MMIQKFRWINERDITTNENQIFLQNKINELVDKVNDLTTNLDGQARTLIEQQDKIAILEEHAHPTATTEPADPYAEQRKALDVAVDALRTVRRYTAINQFAPKSREAHIVAKKALEQITAILENKNGNC